MGLQIHTHAIGDGAVRVAPDACNHALLTNGPNDNRHQIVHLPLIDEQGIPLEFISPQDLYNYAAANHLQVLLEGYSAGLCHLLIRGADELIRELARRTRAIRVCPAPRRYSTVLPSASMIVTGPNSRPRNSDSIFSRSPTIIQVRRSICITSSAASCTS